VKRNREGAILLHRHKGRLLMVGERGVLRGYAFAVIVLLLILNLMGCDGVGIEKTFGECALTFGAQELIKVDEHYMTGAEGEPRVYITYRNISSESVRVRIQILCVTPEYLLPVGVQEDIRGPIDLGRGEKLVYRLRSDLVPEQIENYFLQIHAVEWQRTWLPYAPVGPEVEPEEAIQI